MIPSAWKGFIRAHERTFKKAKENEWISVEERLPHPNIYKIVTEKGCDFTFTAYYNKKLGMFCNKTSQFPNVTHWTEFPKPYTP